MVLVPVAAVVVILVLFIFAMTTRMIYTGSFVAMIFHWNPSVLVMVHAHSPRSA
jgi:hypothetical protein